MAYNNIINNSIKKDHLDYFDIEEKEIKILNEKKEENGIIENDNSFKQLLSLQILIQKYSGLKELCKKKIFNIIYI